MDKPERCGFCGKVRGEGVVVVQSPLDPTALICTSCITFFSESLNQQAVKKFEERYRPDEDSRTD